MKRTLHSYLLCSLLFLAIGIFPVSAQKKDSVVICFRFDTAVIDSTYLTNKENIRKLRHLLSTPQETGNITLQVWSSPEGSYRRNNELAAERADSALAFLAGMPGGYHLIQEGKVDITTVAENWQGLSMIVAERYGRHDREKVLRTLREEGISDDTRKWRLKQLDNGYTWDFIRRRYMPLLRVASMESISLAVKYLAHTPPQLQVRQLYDSHGIITTRATAYPEQTDRKRSSRVFLAVKSNLLYDAALIPNIAIEIPIGKGWSVSAGWNHAWWNASRTDWFWRMYGGEIDIRKYFGKQAEDRTLSGHHLGIYGKAFTYDFETGARGFLSDLSFSGGLEYGYSLPIAEVLNLDFGIGFGYQTGEYKVYDPEDNCYVWKETRQRRWIGPTKAEISLVWMIGSRKAAGKGGAR